MRVAVLSALLLTVFSGQAMAASQALSAAECKTRSALLAKEFDPPGYARKASLPGVLVFVHGLEQDGRSGWSDQKGNFWPALVLCDEFFRDFDVFVAEYHAKDHESLDIREAVDEIATSFAKDSVLSGRREVVIVARDLGGVLIRELLQRQPSVGTLVSVVAWIDPDGDANAEATARITLRDADRRYKLAGYSLLQTGVPQLFRPGIPFQCLALGTGKSVGFKARTEASRFCTTEPLLLPMATDWLPDAPSATVAGWLRRVIPRSELVAAGSSQSAAASSMRSVEVPGPSFNVGCNQSSSGILPLKVDMAANEQIFTAHATVRDQSNLKLASAKVVPSAGKDILIEYNLVGLDRQWTGNCPGGGHGRVVVTVIVKAGDGR